LQSVDIRTCKFAMSVFCQEISCKGSEANAKLFGSCLRESARASMLARNQLGLRAVALHKAPTGGRCAGVKEFIERGRDAYTEDATYKAVGDAADRPTRDSMDLAYLTGQRPADVRTPKHCPIRVSLSWPSRMIYFFILSASMSSCDEDTIDDAD